jgi:hypothetical protein
MIADVREGAPHRLRRTLMGDLDWIVLKAMRKEPEHRYRTCDALSDDLERWLRGEPTRARPVGTIGRLARWCRRNAALAGLLATVAVLFLVGFALVSWQWWRATHYARELVGQRRVAEEQSAQARTQATRAEQHLRQLVRVVREFAHFRSIRDKDPRRSEAFREMVQQFQQVLEDPPDDLELREEIADTCFEVARMGVEVRQSGEVATVLTASVRFYEELARERPDEPRFPAAVAKCLFLQGSFHASRSQYDEALGAAATCSSKRGD